MNYFRKIIYFAIPYKKFAFLNIFFNILYAIFSALSFLALIPMLDVLFNTTKVVYEVPKYDGIINLKEFLINSLNYYISESVISNPEEALLIANCLIILLFFLASCKSNMVVNTDSLNPQNLYDLTISEYNEMLINYNKNKDFPNIDK